MQLSFFGDSSRGGLSGVLASNYFVSKGSAHRDSEATTSVWDSIRGLRYVANNEIPAHDALNADVLKGLVEHEGTPQVSRGMRQNPTPWRPMCGVFLSSNHPPQLPEDERQPDSGTARRLNVVRMPRTFPDDDDKGLKKLINTGAMSPELFWLTRQLYPHLRFLGGRKRMYPIPPRIRSETSEIISGDTKRIIQLWVEENCEAACVYKDGTSHVTVRDTIVARLSLGSDTKAAAAQLRAAGLVEKSNGSVRVFVYAFPSETRPKAVHLKATVNVA